MHLPIMNSIEQVHKTNKTESRIIQKADIVRKAVYGILANSNAVSTDITYYDEKLIQRSYNVRIDIDNAEICSIIVVWGITTMLATDEIVLNVFWNKLIPCLQFSKGENSKWQKMLNDYRRAKPRNLSAAKSSWAQEATSFIWFTCL